MAQTLPRPRNRDDFAIAIICALPLEAEMVQSVFDKDWENEEGIDLGQAKGDQNAYSIGVIGKHNVVLAHMPGMGNTSAAAVATGLRSSYHKIEVTFVVGICGVTPKHPLTQKEIILGDCIISTTVIQYDFGRQYSGTEIFRRKDGVEDTLGRANPTIRAGIAKLQTAPKLKHLSSKLQCHLKALEKDVQIGYPGCHEDRLFKESYSHGHHNTIETCDDCMKDTDVCGKDCETLKCKDSELVKRDRLNGNTAFVPQPQLHFGRYGSANTVLKSGEHRERLVKNEKIVAFEMEGAGVWDNLPTVLVKSACDYADSHKNKKWQKYAAATAAAGLKSVLEFWKTTDMVLEHENGVNLVSADLSIDKSIREADEVICENHRSGGRLLIERLSGEELELEKCFINLALVERRQDRKEKLSFSLEARLRLDASDTDQSIALETLFEPRKLANDKTVVPRRIFIQGRAGIGKTTLCKKIVHEFLEGRIARTLFDRLLWIPLRKLKMSEKEYGWREFLHDAYPLTSPKWRQVKELYADRFYDRTFLSRTLLLFDGLDEISQQWKRDSSIYEFLKTVICDAPNIIITSRPQAHTFSIGYDLDLETVGFTAQQVSKYIRNCVEDENAIVKMEAVIARKPLLQGLLRIPIQLDAFCYTWTSEAYSDTNSSSAALDTDGSSTMTTLYQFIVIELCRKDLRRLRRVDQPQQLMSSQVFPWLKEELGFLAELAFQGMVNNVIEFSPKHQDKVGAHLYHSSIEPSAPYSSILEGLSFLRTSDSGKKDHSKQNYHFIHLTFQEFFAARHFANYWLQDKPLTFLQLTSSSGYQSKIPFMFLQEEKYNPRYNIFWRFVTGLISEKNEVVRFFAQLRAEPIDLLGATHRRLLMYCLSEVVSNQNREVEELCKKEVDLLKQRLITEYKATGKTKLGKEAEFPEQILCDCLQNELDLPYEETLLMIRDRSVVQLETLEAVAGKLVPSFPVVNGLRAAEIFIKHSTVYPPHILACVTTVLITALKDESHQVRCAAAKALGELGAKTSLPEGAINALIPAVLKDEDSGVRQFAARTLKTQSPGEAINVLLAALQNKDENTDVRSYAAKTLEQQSPLPKGAINTLIAALQNRDGYSDVRKCAANVLGAQSSLPERAINAFIVALKDEDLDVRSSAAYALAKQPPLTERAINALITVALKDENRGVRYLVGYELHRQSLTEEVINTLITVFQDKDEHSDVRRAAVVILANQSLSEGAINTLIVALKDEDSDVRDSAAGVLGRQSSLPEEAVNTLIIALKDESSKVRSSAAEALQRQSSLPEEAINAIVRAAENENSDVRSYAITALRKRSSLSKGAINMLVVALKDENFEMRSSAAEVLQTQSSLPEEAINALFTALEDRSVIVRTSAVLALGNQSLSEKAINALIIMVLKDESPLVKVFGVNILKDQPLSEETFVVLAGMFDKGDFAVFKYLYRHESFFRMMKNLGNQTWIHIWCAWRKIVLDEDISCYEIQGSLYVWYDGIRHQISSDPVRTFQLLEAVSNVPSDIPEDDAAVNPALAAENASSKTRMASRSNFRVPLRFDLGPKVSYFF